jgi:hypothetical protein
MELNSVTCLIGTGKGARAEMLVSGKIKGRNFPTLSL